MTLMSWLGYKTLILKKEKKRNPGPAEPRYAQSFQRTGSALFVIKYVNLYQQQSGSSNLIGWNLEVGVAS